MGRPKLSKSGTMDANEIWAMQAISTFYIRLRSHCIFCLLQKSSSSTSSKHLVTRTKCLFSIQTVQAQPFSFNMRLSFSLALAQALMAYAAPAPVSAALAERGEEVVSDLFYSVACHPKIGSKMLIAFKLVCRALAV